MAVNLMKVVLPLPFDLALYIQQNEHVFLISLIPIAKI
jgi:hypothetical protein